MRTKSRPDGTLAFGFCPGHLRGQDTLSCGSPVGVIRPQGATRSKDGRLDDVDHMVISAPPPAFYAFLLLVYDIVVVGG